MGASQASQAGTGRPKSIWTPANIVTCVRIVFIPVFMVFADAAFQGEGFAGLSLFVTAIVSFVLYALLSATDKLDGDLARKRGEVTDFGKFLDPIADKLLVFSALLIFLAHGQLGVWPVFIILFREFLVSALRMVASANGEVIAADMLGKAKTATTMVAICGMQLALVLSVAGLAAGYLMLIVSNVLMGLAVLLTVISGLQYFWNARHVVFRV